MWGFTEVSNLLRLPDCIDALSEWGATLDKLKIPPICDSEEEALLKQIGSEVVIWPDNERETTWFINSPVRTY